jgi:hypothetical protein
MVLLALVGFQDEVPSGDITRDAIAVAGLPFYVGAISSLGIVFWSATASICFFVYSFTRIYRAELHVGRYLLFSGFVTLVLMLDDLFLVHEQVFPEYLSVPKTVVIAVYLILVPLHFIVFRKELMNSELYLLIVAAGFFAVSLFVDLTPSKYLPFIWRLKNYVVEDGAKLLGILTWFVYFSRLSIRALAETTISRIEKPGNILLDAARI